MDNLQVNNYNKYCVEINFNPDSHSSDEKEKIIEEVKQIIVMSNRDLPTEILIFEKEPRILFIALVETNSLSYRKKTFNSFFEKTLIKFNHNIIPLNNEKIKVILIQMLNENWICKSIPKNLI